VLVPALLIRSWLIRSDVSVASSFGYPVTKSFDEIAFAESAVPSLENSFVDSRTYGGTGAYLAAAMDVDQKIIKTGYLTFVVDDVSQSMVDITTLAGTLEGFVQSSSMYEQEDGTKTGDITLRIPSVSFETGLQSLKDLAVFVSYESTSGTDVTEEYTDYVARLTTAQAQEAAYLLILNRANTVEEILQVQEALGQIRTEIEILEGHLKYLDDRTTYSTISVSLSEEALVTIPSKEFRPWSAVKQAAQALVALVQSLAIFSIWFVIVGGGILLPLLLLAWIVWKLVRKYLRRKNS
jgi:hypothetical protein